MKNEEDRFADRLAAAAAALGEPPEPRREAIWQRIDTRRRVRRTADVSAPRPRRWRQGLGLAAALALGITLGRFALPAPASIPAPPDGNTTGDEVAFRAAATHHLVRTETLLTTFPIDAQEGRTLQVARWAYDLLLDTRVLLDSPAGADPAMAALLTDLELVLAQLATLRTNDAASELVLIQEGIRQNDVLARLRSETSGQGAEGM